MVPYPVSDSVRSPSRRLRLGRVVPDSAEFSNPDSMQHPLCHDNESSVLIQFKQSFLIDEHASSDPSAYPKVAMWKSQGEEGEGSDCCSWDGVECDKETGNVISLHLASSCLYGSINSSNSLFNLAHLRRLDLSDNYFNYSKIPFAVGRLSRLRSLNLYFWILWPNPDGTLDTVQIGFP